MTTQDVRGISITELRGLPVVVDEVTAGRAFGLGRTKTHEMVRAGTFPVPVLRLGRTYRVRRADLLKAVGEVDRARGTDDQAGRGNGAQGVA